MDTMKIKSAKYVKNEENIKTSIDVIKIDDSVIHVPLAPDNTDYAEIMRQVDAGELTIKDAD